MTTRHRLVTYVSPELHQLVSETADALGQTNSKMLAEILENSAAMLEVMRDLATELNSAPSKQRQVLGAFATEIRTMLRHAENELLPIETAASRPPTSNRGVTHPKISISETPGLSK